MFNSGKKSRQKKNTNSCVVRKKNSVRDKKPYPPPPPHTPLELNGRSLTKSVFKRCPWSSVKSSFYFKIMCTNANTS